MKDKYYYYMCSMTLTLEIMTVGQDHDIPWVMNNNYMFVIYYPNLITVTSYGPYNDYYDVCNVTLKILLSYYGSNS